jgi:hypothetical protein
MDDSGKGESVYNHQEEIDKNLEFFLRELPNLPPGVNGKFALLRHQSIIDYYDTILDALKVGNYRFDDRLFSVQQVTNFVADLGFYSHAMPVGNP